MRHLVTWFSIGVDFEGCDWLGLGNVRVVGVGDDLVHGITGYGAGMKRDGWGKEKQWPGLEDNDLIV
jgi:hypothetical protein